MSNELRRLYNTMVTIETKGESTKTMCDCLRFLEQLIATSEEKTSECEEVTSHDEN